MDSRDIIPLLDQHYYSQRSWYVFTMGEAWFNRQVERFLFTYQSTGHPDAHHAHYMPKVERMGLEMEQFSHYMMVE
jgi:hypothetical protein